MCRLQCLLAFTLSIISIANSWDIAITTGNQIEFYNEGIKVNSATNLPSSELTALAYDAVYNILLFVDKHNDNASIFSFDINTKEIKNLVRTMPYENIEGVAFDPVTGTLFWTDIKKGIFSKSLRDGSNNDDFGTLRWNLTKEEPRAIAVDSCNGYIYWSNTAYEQGSISRARIDGSEMEVIVSKDIFKPLSIAIDQRARQLYWIDDDHGIYHTIKKSDLDGKNIEVVLTSSDDHRPNYMAVSKDAIYWTDWKREQPTVWKTTKFGDRNRKPSSFITFPETPFGVVANYDIEEEIRDVPECRGLSELLKSRPPLNGSIVAEDAGIFCLHGHQVGFNACKCTAGFTGARCEIPLCRNYCLHGNCSFSDDGEPKCSCEPGYIGRRCEVHKCENYCLNGGDCSLVNKQPTCKCLSSFNGSRCEVLRVGERSSTEDLPVPSKSGEVIPPKIDVDVCKNYCLRGNCVVADGNPTCTCPEGFSGERCEADLCSNQCLNNGVCTINSGAPVCACSADYQGSRCELRRTDNNSLPVPVPDGSDGEFVQGPSCDGWDPIRDPVLVLLGVLSGLLIVSTAVLFTKVLHLKKRPRIRKRIIVNKNVTPLTARPDQCEITIENCCNMNICETPCFEPRSTIRPNLLDAKPGKEEKKNLIANMELPEDY